WTLDRLWQPTHITLVSQTVLADPTAIRLAACEQSPGPRAASYHRVRRSCRSGRSGRASVTPSRYSPAPSQSLPLALHSHALRMLRHPARAPLGVPTSHGALKETPRDVHMPPAPCTPAAAPTSATATLPRLHCRCRSPPCSRPPAACLPSPLRAPSRQLRA